MGDAKIGQRGSAIEAGAAAGVGSGRQRQTVSLPQRGTEDRIHKAGGARRARQPNQLHGSVYDGRRGNAIQVQELVKTQSENVKDVGVDSLDRPIREMFDQVVKASLPSQCARDDLGREGRDRVGRAGARGRAQVRTEGRPAPSAIARSA